MEHSFPLKTLIATCVVSIIVFACSSPPSTAIPIPTVTLTSPVLMLLPTPTIEMKDYEAVEPEQYATYDSPDGNWRIDVIIYDYGCPSSEEAWSTPSVNASYEQLLLTNLQNGRVQEVDRQQRGCDGFGGYGFEKLEWSSNSRYFFYTNSRTMGNVGGGCGYLATPILRLDLESLESLPLGSGERSPDQARYATWILTSFNQPQLLITQIEQGTMEQWEFEEKGAVLTSLVWSSDSQALAYLQSETGCPFGQSYVTYLNLMTGEQRLLLQSDSPTFAQIEWHNADQLLLRDSDSQEWLYDLLNGTLERFQ